MSGYILLLSQVMTVRTYQISFAPLQALILAFTLISFGQEVNLRFQKLFIGGCHHVFLHIGICTGAIETLLINQLLNQGFLLSNMADAFLLELVVAAAIISTSAKGQKKCA